MTELDRVPDWVEDLKLALAQAAGLVERGRAAFDEDPALPLAFEALSNRIGELAKKLMSADPVRFGDPVWSQAAKNRDFVVHQYRRLDVDTLWRTATTGFPELRRALDRS